MERTAARPVDVARELALLLDLPDAQLAAMCRVLAEAPDPRATLARWVSVGMSRQCRHVPDELRAAVVARDGMVCTYCLRALKRREVRLDHVVPVSAGGLATVANLKVACTACNTEKDVRPAFPCARCGRLTYRRPNGERRCGCA